MASEGRDKEMGKDKKKGETYCIGMSAIKIEEEEGIDEIGGRGLKGGGKTDVIILGEKKKLSGSKPL